MRLMRLAIYVLSVVLIFFGLLWMTASYFAPIRLLTGFVMLIIAGSLIYIATRLLKEPIPLEDYESKVINLAKLYQGKLTTGQVSADLAIPSKKARDTLNQLARRGVCNADIEETKLGVSEVFIFPEFAQKTKSD